MPLTPKQERFCEEYLVDLNATAAARRAGYSPATANEQAARLLAKISVKERIAALRAVQSQKTEITVERVVRELGLLGFHNPLDVMRVQSDGSAYLDFSRLTRDQAAAITEITVEEYTEGRGDDSRAVKRTKAKFADKKGALETLGRHLGMFDDKLRLTGAGGGPIEVAMRAAVRPDFSQMTDEELDDWLAGRVAQPRAG